MSKSLVQYASVGLIGLMTAFSIGAATLTIGVQNAHAQAVNADDLFGGGTNAGSDFAGEAGLSQGDLIDTIAALIRVVLGFLGIVAVIIILAGGFKWMTSGGEDAKVKDAKKLMVSGVIGLAIVLAAFAISSFVVSSLVGALNNASN